ncbi:ATP-binding protein [Streptomyces sp. BK239]|uniref:ATP-binding protein n=1 Tax=Streptomyces sp. BK239 TaxID=2512155 RepID=UPI00102C8539|nr:ATP-binding protein [Streptomyces sp. BK239]RZU24669.1 anti-sigma regulatory factor (Ser/Thr protein kinase) [Streptomyces sp. BK239]
MPGNEVTEPQPRCVLPFEAVPSEISLLRRAAAKQLSRWGVSAAAEEAELLVTELATNVLKHVGEGAAATLVLERRDGRLRVEMHDRSETVPVLRAGGWESECGRGLHMLEALTEDWGTALTAVGKSVWCEVRVDSAGLCPRIERATEVLERYGNRVATPISGRYGRVCMKDAAIALIADLLHWTAACGGDPDGVLDQAQARYEGEVAA